MLFASLRGWRPSWLPHDLAAGLLLTAIAVPEQVATARLAGMPAESGLVAFIVATLAFLLLGRSRFLSVGADSTIAPIFAGGLAAFVAFASPDYRALVPVLAIAVGLILLMAAVLRAGWIADLLSIPVTNGFLAGIAIHIGVGELAPLLGLPGAGGGLLAQLSAAVSGLGACNAYALAIGLGAALATILTERYAPHWPGALFAVLLGSGAAALFGLDQHGVVMMAPLSSLALPAPALSLIPLADLLRLLPLALILALVCMMQTATVLRAFPDDADPLAPLDRNFAGVGLGSIAAGLAGAFPVNASPPRTAAVVEGGGRSQLAALVSAGAVLCLLLLGGSLFRLVPQPALAGILLAIAVRLFRLQEMAAIWRQNRPESLLVLASAVLVVVLPIEIGMLCSIGLSLAQSIYGIARPRCVALARVPGTTIWWPPEPGEAGERLPGTLVFAIGAPVNFTNALSICRQLEAMVAAAPEPVRRIVLEASGVVGIDYTGARLLGLTIGRLKARGIPVAMARLSSEKAQCVAARSGLLSRLGEDAVFHSVEDAIQGVPPSR
ncbi:SulP family inorganic anion transporter [Acidisoma sp. 7E03]